MLALVLRKREELLGPVMLQGSPGCGEHEMVELEMVRAVRRMPENVSALELTGVDLSVFKDLVGRMPWDRAVESRVGQDLWLNLRREVSR